MRKIYTAITIMLFSASSFAGIGTGFISGSVLGQVTPTMETSFIEFSIPDQVTSTIDATTATVEVTMPYGADLSALTPTFTLYTGATAWVAGKQVSSTVDALDFSSAVVYTIVNGTDSTDWTVTATTDAGVKVNFNLDMAAQTVNEGDFWLLDGDVIYVTGSYDGVESWGWDKPGTGASVMLEDADGDNIYTGSIQYAKNASFEYKYFLNASWDHSDGFTNDHPDNNRTAEVGDVDLDLEDTWVAIVNKPISVQDNTLDKVSMCPNPVRNELRISNLDGVSRVVVSNLLGQSMVTKNVTDARMSINTSEFKNGIYIVTLVSENGSTRSQKIVKE